MPVSILKTVREFFGMTLSEMKEQWVPLPESDKQDIIKGLTDGSLTY